MALLEIKNLTIEYEVEKVVVHAVNDVSLSIEQGETLGLVGETGAGKTTTAKGILGLIPDPPGRVVSGEVLYKGEDLLKKSNKEMRAIRGEQISMIFQDPMSALNPTMKIVEQIAEVIRLHKDCSEAEAQRGAIDILEKVGIRGERGEEYPHQFSGGMKQRVVIAIALACSPELLIADEPTTALDVTIQAQILEMMRELKAEFNTSMLLITHDLGVVAQVCNKVATMYAGEIVEYGTLEDIFDHTSHPYTEGLFNSIPRMGVRAQRLKPIEGLMPDPSDLPSGCYFSPRCPYATEKCMKEHPPTVDVGGGHLVKCHRYTEGGLANG